MLFQFCTGEKALTMSGGANPVSTSYVFVVIHVLLVFMVILNVRTPVGHHLERHQASFRTSFGTLFRGHLDRCLAVIWIAC